MASNSIKIDGENNGIEELPSKLLSVMRGFKWEIDRERTPDGVARLQWKEGSIDGGSAYNKWVFIKSLGGGIFKKGTPFSTTIELNLKVQTATRQKGSMSIDMVYASGNLNIKLFQLEKKLLSTKELDTDEAKNLTGEVTNILQAVVNECVTPVD